MVGIILITHGTLGNEFIKVSSRIYGEPKQLYSVAILPDEAKSVATENLKKAVTKADTGDGVLLLTDGFGGSPSNLCLAFLKDINCEIVTGLNLSMLLETLCYQDRLGLKELAQRAETGGKRGIVYASELLRQKMDSAT
jgi:PTS system mannose-specific IIA component